jgi:hypothetical protein
MRYVVKSVSRKNTVILTPSPAQKPRNPLFYTPHTAVHMHDLTGYEG